MRRWWERAVERRLLRCRSEQAGNERWWSRGFGEVEIFFVMAGNVAQGGGSGELLMVPWMELNKFVSGYRWCAQNFSLNCGLSLRII